MFCFTKTHCAWKGAAKRQSNVIDSPANNYCLWIFAVSFPSNYRHYHRPQKSSERHCWHRLSNGCQLKSIIAAVTASNDSVLLYFGG